MNAPIYDSGQPVEAPVTRADFSYITALTVFMTLSHSYAYDVELDVDRCMGRVLSTIRVDGTDRSHWFEPRLHHNHSARWSRYR